MAGDILEVPLRGHVDLEAAEAARCAAFQLEGRRPPWIVIRSWNHEVRLYRNLVRHLHPEQPVITLGPPQGDKKHDFPRTVERWTEDCLSRLAWADVRGALRLGGWSFGGVLALETARKLERIGRRIDGVVMLDTRLPRAHPEEGRRARTIPHAVVHHLNELFEMGPEKRRAYVRERVDWQWYHARRRWADRLQKHFGRGRPPRQRPDGRSPEPRDTSRMTLLQKALWVAYLKYQPRECSIPVTQFWCADTCRHVEDSSLGWSRFLRGPMESRPIEGEHMTLFDEEHARSLGPAVQRALDAIGGAGDGALPLRERRLASDDGR